MQAKVSRCAPRGPRAGRHGPPRGHLFVDPTACERCGAVYRRKVWRHVLLDLATLARTTWDICPACRQQATGHSGGRLVLLEQRFGDLQGQRQRELGLRHVTALAVAAGAGATDCVRTLAGFGCAPEEAARLFIRCARGSAPAGRGLCRELEYLPAWLRVSSALTASLLGVEARTCTSASRAPACCTE